MKLILGVALPLAAALLPPRAEACSYPAVVVESTYPRPGAVGVPTNAVPFIYGPALQAEQLTLRDATGAEVPVERRQVEPSGVDLVPLVDLAANQDYEVRLTELPEPVLTFRTGVGPAAVPDRLDPPALEVVVLEYSFASCGEVTNICADATVTVDASIEVRVGGEVLSPGLGEPWPLSRAYGQGLRDDECVEVRARDVRGNRSAPSVACGDALNRVRLRSDMFDVSYDCESYTSYIEARSSGSDAAARPAPDTDAGTPDPIEGCAVRRGPLSPRGWAATALLLWSLAARRQSGARRAARRERALGSSGSPGLVP